MQSDYASALFYGNIANDGLFSSFAATISSAAIKFLRTCMSHQTSYLALRYIPARCKSVLSSALARQWCAARLTINSTFLLPFTSAMFDD